MPGHGDPSICFACGTLLYFGPDLELLAMTQEQMDTYDTDLLMKLHKIHMFALKRLEDKKQEQGLSRRRSKGRKKGK